MRWRFGEMKRIFMDVAKGPTGAPSPILLSRGHWRAWVSPVPAPQVTAAHPGELLRRV